MIRRAFCTVRFFGFLLGLFLSNRENGLPVILHAYNRPVLGRSFVEAFVQLADMRRAVMP
jgi:hypothetical protein